MPRRVNARSIATGGLDPELTMADNYLPFAKEVRALPTRTSGQSRGPRVNRCAAEAPSSFTTARFGHVAAGVRPGATTLGATGFFL
jgi:hypothetical protein